LHALEPWCVARNTEALHVGGALEGSSVAIAQVRRVGVLGGSGTCRAPYWRAAGARIRVLGGHERTVYMSRLHLRLVVARYLRPLASGVHGPQPRVGRCKDGRAAMCDPWSLWQPGGPRLESSPSHKLASAGTRRSPSRHRVFNPVSRALHDRGARARM